jgi:hypothetical protein
MADKDEEYRLRLDRIKVGVIAVVVIEVPLLSLLALLSLSDLISFFAFYIGELVVGIGGMLAALAIADFYIKKKQLNRS